MMLPVPIPTVDPGPDWANNLYACLYSQVDSHDHSSGKGVLISQDGIGLLPPPVAGLNFNANSAISLLTTSYLTQPAPLSTSTFPYAVYVSGGNLYYNSASTAIQLTTPTTVNATSSGISSGTATASFVSGVLVVNEATNTPANIQAGSILIGDNTAGSNYVTIAPAASTSAYTITLAPTLPSTTVFLTESTSGNLGGVSTVGGITGSNIAANTIVSNNLAANLLITGTFTAEAGLYPTGTSNVFYTGYNASGPLALEEGFPPGGNLSAAQFPITYPTSGSFPLMLMRGQVSSTGTIVNGEGFTIAHGTTGGYEIIFTYAFNDIPSVTITGVTGIVVAQINSATTTAVTFTLYNLSGVATNSAFNFIACGQYNNG